MACPIVLMVGLREGAMKDVLPLDRLSHLAYERRIPIVSPGKPKTHWILGKGGALPFT